MKTLLSIASMMPYLPAEVKDAVNHVAKDAGIKTDSLELHRHTHSEKSMVNQLDPKSRQSLSYVSARTQDRDDEIVIPTAIDLKEFRKYKHCLVNHNYSLLPVGSDETIEADDYGIKALTTHADTGEGTLANVVWALVSQGHLKSKSIGFVPTSFTKPGARDWDHVANQLQSNWGEFDKGRAEKSISRIITGGVLLEHSFVSVPCNADAEMISVCKAMKIEGAVAKQLGWEMKDGILVVKAAAEPVPCVCDECGYVADAVVGSKCPECKTGDMKAKGKEKAIEVRDKGMGNFSADDLRSVLNRLMFPNPTSSSPCSGEYVMDVYEDHFVYNKNNTLFSQGYAVVDGKPQLVGEPEKVERQTIYTTLADGASKGFHSHAVEKPNAAMPGGSFSACVLIMEDKGHETESAQKICGALQADAGGKGLTKAETKAVEEVTGKAYYTECVCDECGVEADTNPGEACQEPDCDGTMEAVKGEKKKIAPVIKVVRPAPSVKVLFVPPNEADIALRVGEAVEKALSRRTGKIM